MSKFTLLFLFIITSINISSWAKSRFDLSTEALVRTYSLVGASRANLGYGLVFWGNDNKKPWYGYIRPSVTGTLSKGFSAGRAQIEFFPVSILGFRGGKEYSDLNEDHPSFDCITYKCAQKFTRSFVGVNFTIGAAGYFLNLDKMREKWNPEVHDQEFVQPVYALIFAREGEEIDTTRATIGKKINDRWTVIALGMYSKTVETNKRARFAIGGFIYKPVNSFGITFGVGTFGSTLRTTNATSLLSLKWKISPSVGLF